MGFLLSIHTDGYNYKEEDVAFNSSGFGGTNYYKEASLAMFNVQPAIKWAMAKPLTANNGIKPSVLLALKFRGDHNKHLDYNSDGSTSGDADVDYSRDSTDIAVDLGLGGVTLKTIGRFTLAADIGYALVINTYNNEYNYTDGELKIEKIKGINDDGTLKELKGSNHTIKPQVNVTFNATDKLAIKSRVDLVVGFGSTTSTEMELEGSGPTLVKDGDDSKMNTFLFQPKIVLAFQYKIVPSKLTLSVGGTLQPTTINTKKIATEEYDSGEKVPNSGTVTAFSINYGTVGTSLTAGLTFNLSENLAIDASTGIKSTNSFNLINNLLSFSSISMLFSF
jgi:hypothetical protein